MRINTVSVIGLGYIGLPTAALVASRGIRVIGVDVNESTVNTINEGRIHIIEPDLDIMVSKAVRDNLLIATTQPQKADVFLIAVPTPFKGDDHEPDISYIEEAILSIAPVIEKGNLIILESTSPVGTTEKIELWLKALRPDLNYPTNNKDVSDIRIAYCPERVLPGKIILELNKNNRVIGGLTSLCTDAAAAFYASIIDGECIKTNARTAEMCKLTENSFRDVNIAFANELSIICSKLDINVWELISLANQHPRVNVLNPGPGVGGHCIAVDPWFIVNSAPDEAKLISTARDVNDSKPEWVIDNINKKITDYLEVYPHKTLSSLKIACYGLAFKPDIDDLRESPAVLIAKKLIEKYTSTTLLAIEPNISTLPQDLSNLKLVTAKDALEQADIHILLVDHKQFKDCKPVSDFIVDTRGIWS